MPLFLPRVEAAVSAFRSRYPGACALYADDTGSEVVVVGTEDKALQGRVVTLRCAVDCDCVVVGTTYIEGPWRPRCDALSQAKEAAVISAKPLRGLPAPKRAKKPAVKLNQAAS